MKIAAEKGTVLVSRTGLGRREFKVGGKGEQAPTREVATYGTTNKGPNERRTRRGKKKARWRGSGVPKKRISSINCL